MTAPPATPNEPGLRDADVRALCVWLRSGYRTDDTHVPIPDAVTGYTHLPWTDVAALLLDAAHAAVDDATAATEDVAVWAAVYGVTAEPTPIAQICAATGYGAHILRRRVRRVETELARRLRPRTGEGRARTGPDRSGSAAPDATTVEEATALVHARAAADHTRSDRLAHLEPRTTRLPARTPRQRKAVERTRRRMAAAIVRELDRGSSSILPRRGPQFLVVDGEPDRGPADESGAHRRRPPAVEKLRELVDETERGLAVRDPALFETARRASRGFARFLTSPDPVVEARLWAVRASLWREEESLRAVWAAQQIENLVGPDHLLAMRGNGDAAISLRAHGYLRAASRRAQRGLRVASTHDGGPAARIVRRASLLTVVASIARLQLRNGAGPWLDRLEASLVRVCDQCEQLGEPSQLAWLPVLYRRLGQLQLARSRPGDPDATISRGVAARAARWLDRSASSAAELHRPTTGSDALVRAHSSPTGAIVILGHHLATMRLMLELGDGDGYLESARSFVRLWAAEPWYPNFADDYRLLAAAALRRHGWTAVGELPPLAPVLAGRDWSDIATPPPGSPRRRRLPTI